MHKRRVGDWRRLPLGCFLNRFVTRESLEPSMITNHLVRVCENYVAHEADPR